MLYGPNDLGKSTIAIAMRAALLTPPSSSEADTYASWFTAENPRVELTFADNEERYWKVKKTFGTSASSSAELLYSKDGMTFTPDCKGRQVEEKLRAMLAWGIPAPGGRGAPRGAPDSFLATALLGAQDEADDILEASIAEDPDESGKLRLTHALAALAQDPLFKRVLDSAQREVDSFFTDTGQRRRGQSSPFKEAGDRVKALNAELSERSRQLQASQAIEGEVSALRVRHADTLAASNDAQSQLAATQRCFAASETRRKVAERLAADKEALGRIDAEVGRAQALAGELKECEVRAVRQKATSDAATLAFAAAESEVRAAEDALRAANSEDAARERALEQAQLEKGIAELGAALGVATARKAEIESAISARTQASAADKAVAASADALETAKEARAREADAVGKRATELETARAILAYIRWRAAVTAVEEAGKAAAAARHAEEEATRKDAEAVKLEAQAQTTEAGLEKRAAKLPGAEQLQALQELERELERAEAALGGGLSVAVRPTRKLGVRVQLDDEAPKDTQLAAERTFDAQRQVRLVIAEVGELNITAGSAEQRKAVDELRSRWRDDAQPVLTKAQVKTLRDIVDLRAALTTEQAAVGELKHSAERLRLDAKSLRDQATIHQGTAAPPFTPEQLEARKAAIGAQDVQQIEEQYRTLGKPPEARVEQLHEELARAHRKLSEGLATSDESVRMAEFQLAERRKSASELNAAWKAKAASLGSGDVDELLASTRQETTRIEQAKSRGQAQLAELATTASSTVESAKQSVTVAQGVLGEAKAARDGTLVALEEVRGECSRRKGALDEMRARIEQLDRGTAVRAVEARESELAALPAETPTTTIDVEQAEARVRVAAAAHEQAKSDLNVKEGSLAHVGGAALREEVQRLEEARTAAQARERELEVDADAWKLLRDTLRETENEEGTHLGRALAGPVTQRFEQLTQGRYSGLRLDASLRAEGLSATASNSGGSEVLEALSVGTRAQLAVLLRLSIADQMRSTVVLDDHLVHTDAIRLDWFQDALRRIAVNTQVIVITCRSQDYLSVVGLPADGPATVDLAAGTVRAVDMARAVDRFGNADAR